MAKARGKSRREASATKAPVVDVADRQKRYRKGTARVVAVARHVLESEDRPDARLSVTLVTDEEIAEMHEVYLDEPGPTDVISFPLQDEHDPTLGEVVVSTDTAAREATERGLELDEEVLRYVVHGTLHLLGYDDHLTKDRRRMHARQEKLLAEALSRLGRVARKRPRA